MLIGNNAILFPTATPDSQVERPPLHARPSSYMVDSWDEYNAYDLSEFSAADFMQFDSMARREHNHNSESATGVVVTGGAQGRVDTNGSGGPRIAVALEHAANESVVLKAAEGTSWTKDIICRTQAQNANKTGNSEPTDLRHPHMLDTRSPYQRHRSNGTLSVSDLVGPAWYVPIPFVMVGRCITHIKVRGSIRLWTSPRTVSSYRQPT